MEWGECGVSRFLPNIGESDYAYASGFPFYQGFANPNMESFLFLDRETWTRICIHQISIRTVATSELLSSYGTSNDHLHLWLSPKPMDFHIRGRELPRLGQYLIPKGGENEALGSPLGSRGQVRRARKAMEDTLEDL